MDGRTDSFAYFSSTLFSSSQLLSGPKLHNWITPILLDIFVASVKSGWGCEGL